MYVYVPMFCSLESFSNRNDVVQVGFLTSRGHGSDREWMEGNMLILMKGLYSQGRWHGKYKRVAL